ncbi:hypothetical protein SY83_08620 [Paenibacillus swuensis]|uniref:glycine oxidase n=1 Tax=Paenibacillus swuensis TaxID=1178515 RepID=A0A172TH38_9BACL|nr:glycine oxidase ThiO [Paenibacillus swuensis]ANE46330.1 hypothetical protein SY83_08620 [Paenibacillus swuensis]
MSETNVKHADVIVVGGGIIGCSAAFQMAKRGMKVIVLDSGGMGGEASGAAAGMLAAQAEMQQGGPLYAWALESRGMFPALAQELKNLSGVDIELMREGLLIPVLTEEGKDELQTAAQWQRLSGEEAEWLDSEALQAREPELSAWMLGALSIPGDGQVSAPQLVKGYKLAAEAYGAAFREYENIHEIWTERGKVRGVRTARKTYFAHQVVVTAGCWTGNVLKETGLVLPMIPVKGECISVIADKPLLRSTLFSHCCYLVPKRGNRILIGATSTEGTYDKRLTTQGVLTLLERASAILPGIVHTEFERGWTGLRPQTPDGLPYIGLHPDVQGLIIAAGHYRNGVLLSPITGQWIADLVEGKGAWELGIEALSISRIGLAAQALEQSGN